MKAPIAAFILAACLGIAAADPHGHVRDSLSGIHLPGASVTWTERNLTVTTDANGWFSFDGSGVRPGSPSLPAYLLESRGTHLLVPREAAAALTLADLAGRSVSLRSGRARGGAVLFDLAALPLGVYALRAPGFGGARLLKSSPDALALLQASGRFALAQSMLPVPLGKPGAGALRVTKAGYHAWRGSVDDTADGVRIDLVSDRAPCLWPAARPGTGGKVLHYDRPACDASPRHYRIAVVQVRSTGSYADSARTPGLLEMWDSRSLGDLMFTDPRGMNAFYREASYGKISLSGAVVDWIDTAVADLDPDSMWSHKDEYIDKAAAWLRFADYDAFYLVGKTPVLGSVQIGWAFQNTLSTSQGVIPAAIMGMINSTVHTNPDNGYVNAKILPGKSWAHEFGHAFLLGHANGGFCDTVPACDDWEPRGYGNIFSVMGSGEKATHFDAHMKQNLGVFDTGQFPSVTADGEFTLYPLSRNDGRLKAVRIPLPDTVSGGNILAVEYRGNFGFDRFTEEVRNPALMRSWTSITGDPDGFIVTLSNACCQAGYATTLIDMHPKTPFTGRGVYTAGDVGKMADAFLNTGESFVEPKNGFSLTNLGPTLDGGMRLKVDFR